MDLLLPGVDDAATALSPDGGPDAATAIMTTDSVPKTAQVSVGGFTVGGMAKGAGMLAPGLATMLVVLTTDAVADCAAAGRRAARRDPGQLRPAGLRRRHVHQRHRAAAGLRRVRRRAEPELLAAAVTRVCKRAGRAAAGRRRGRHQGDRASRCVHAATEDDAVEVGRAVARNNLVKTAFFGQDANWGRILAAVGTVGPHVAFDADAIDVAINGVLDLPGRRHRRRPRRWSTSPAGRCTSSSTCTPAPRPRRS